MNSRIQKLAEQAGFDVKRLLEPYPGGFPREDALALESFAHLIVRECMAQCTKVEDDDLSDYEGGFRDGVLLCYQEIKDHFGVER